MQRKGSLVCKFSLTGRITAIQAATAEEQVYTRSFMYFAVGHVESDCYGTFRPGWLSTETLRFHERGP
eukprot:4531378-Pyramimonas_sp.AAC.3